MRLICTKYIESKELFLYLLKNNLNQKKIADTISSIRSKFIHYLNLMKKEKSRVS